jgi:hypothetical protein
MIFVVRAFKKTNRMRKCVCECICEQKMALFEIQTEFEHVRFANLFLLKILDVLQGIINKINDFESAVAYFQFPLSALLSKNKKKDQLETSF